ncbi:MAG TPA: LysR family transcriptional regulator, partial [Alphaproteobacteria bacterium]|nr:LysR family transcriptional regulator [Alphaproteobacteria bacterium]
MKPPPPLNYIRSFECSARHLSFTDAANELGYTQAAISNHVRALEQYLGRQLFIRYPRSLKLTEMSLTMADAHTFLEYRHGPMALVDEQHLVVGLISDDMRDYEIEVLREVKRFGGRVLAIANSDRALLDLDEVLAIRAN